VRPSRFGLLDEVEQFAFLAVEDDDEHVWQAPAAVDERTAAGR
jgi:hypothetical protein